MSRCFEVLGSPSFPPALLIFLTGFSEMGIVKSIGMFVADITVELGTTSTDIGTALGLLTALNYIPALLVAAIYRQRSFRRVLLICGSCLIALGIISTSMATSKVWLPVCLAVTGLGSCVLLTSGSIILNDFGSPHFNLIWSSSTSGYGVGMVALPLLAEFLRQLYGWRGGLLLLGGLVANIIPCAVAVKVPATSAEHRTDMRSSNDDMSERPSCSVPKDNGAKANILFESMYSDATEDETDSDSEVGLMSLRIKDSSANDHTRLSTDIEEQSDEPSGNFLNILLADFRKSDFYLDPVFNVLFLSIFCVATVYSGWHAFLVPRELQRGISRRTALQLTFFAAAGSVTGRVLVGVLCDNYFKPVKVYVLFTLLNIASLLCDVFLPNFYLIMLTTYVSAFVLAGRPLLGTLAAKERASAANKDVIFACSFFCFGMGNLLGGYLSGMIADVFSSYDVTFQFLAGIEVIVFLLMLGPMLIKKPSSA